MAEGQGWPRKPRLRRRSEREGGSRQRVPGSPRQPPESWAPRERAGVAWPKRCPRCRDPPCALRLRPETGPWLTWDKLSRSGEAAPGSWHSFPNLPDPLINASFFKSHRKVWSRELCKLPIAVTLF